MGGLDFWQYVKPRRKGCLGRRCIWCFSKTGNRGGFAIVFAQPFYIADTPSCCHMNIYQRVILICSMLRVDCNKRFTCRPMTDQLPAFVDVFARTDFQPMFLACYGVKQRLGRFQSLHANGWSLSKLGQKKLLGLRCMQYLFLRAFALQGCSDQSGATAAPWMPSRPSTALRA